ncbi:hypothetical protein JTE90_024853 [Oedothorax gibbosus]|uniref:Uncharacterized protein n=1 Tax=Oedothorax gibbosus TaxID=931172 RepID=A0AAV6V2V1_9ARAC|nr:hypothetical protein JTE90_024853 [Oedothorax gibbosus]
MNQASRKAPSSSYSLEMLLLNVTAFIKKRCDLNTSISDTELSKSTLKDESPKNEESPTFVSDKNKTYTAFSNAFDSSSSKTGGGSLDGNLEDTTDSNLDSFTAASTLSLNEEAFIGEINKIELKKQGNLSTINTGTFLKGLDVGTSKLVQSNTDNPLSKTNCRSLDGDLEDTTDSNSESFPATSTLSLNEEAFIGEINKVELKKQSNISTIKTGDVNFCTSKLVQSNSDNHTIKINELEFRHERGLNDIKPDSFLKGVDVVFGTAKLVQSSIEAHTVKIVPSNSKTAVNEHKKRIEVHEARKVGVRFSETPKANFSIPKEKVQQRPNAGSAEIRTILPPNWSPCNVYAARQIKRQIQHIPNLHIIL